MLSQQQVGQALQGSLVVHRLGGGQDYYGQAKKVSQRGLWFEGRNNREELLMKWVRPQDLSFPRILSVEEIRGVIATEQIVRLILWNATYLYAGVVVKELVGMNTPDGMVTPTFYFEGNILGRERVSGNFQVIPGQLFG